MGWAIGSIWGVQNTPGRSLGGKMEVISSKVACSKLTVQKWKRVFDFLQNWKITWNYKVSSKDFDQGESCLLSHMTPWPQYRTYKPPPYPFLNIQTSPGPVFPMPAKSKHIQGNLSHDDFFCNVGSKFSFKLAWGIDATLQQKIQTFNKPFWPNPKGIPSCHR